MFENTPLDTSLIASQAKQRAHMKLMSLKHPDQDMRAAVRAWLRGSKLAKKQRNAVKFLLKKMA